MFIEIHGIKATQIIKYGQTRGEREPYVLKYGDETVGYKEEILHFSLLVRTGEEQIVNAPPKAMCVWQGGSGHPIKAGVLVYDLGPKTRGIGNSYFCPKHIGLLPLLSDVIERYRRNVRVPEVTITNTYNREILLNKKRVK